MVFITVVRHPLGMLIQHSWPSYQLLVWNGIRPPNPFNYSLKKPLTKKHLAFAMDAIEWFSIILIMEEMQATTKMLCKQLHWSSCPPLPERLRHVRPEYTDDWKPSLLSR